jgi:probable addiction module antidote protein
MKTSLFDPADYLKSDVAIEEYMKAAMETGDAGHIARSLGVVARAKGMTQVAEQSGLSRESLYRALSETGNPELATVVKVMTALGLRLSAASAIPDHA